MSSTIARTLAASIRHEHEQVHHAIAAGLQHAREAGRLLVEARDQIAHGGWIRFVEQDCGLSRSTAAGYVRVHERWRELEPYVQRAAHLPLRRALALLAEPRQEPAAVPSLEHAMQLQDEDGDDRDQLAELQRTLERQDATIDELRAVIDEAGRLERRAFERRATATRAIGVLLTSAPEVPAGMRMRARDGSRTAYLHPSEHAGFVFYNVIDEAANTVDGGKRAIVRAEAMTALAHLGFPVAQVTWDTAPAETTWTFNELLYDSREDYMQRAVLGGDGYLDNPALLTSADEHRAAAARWTKEQA